MGEDLVVPEKKKALNIELSVADDSAAVAALIKVRGEAQIGETKRQRESGWTLLATTIKPPFAIDAEGKDDVTKWPRGSTFPAPVLIERDAGFQDDIVLEMTSRQGRHRQGIRGPELTVPPGVTRILYPVYLPEWLETTRTSRMVVNGVAKVKDPKGNVRYSVSKQKTRMGFLPVGALLKLSTKRREVRTQAGGAFSLPFSINRAKQLDEPVRLELLAPKSNSNAFTAKPVIVSSRQRSALLSVEVSSGPLERTEHELTIRATAMQRGTLPVVSEAKVIVVTSDVSASSLVERLGDER